ncbi:MAG: PilZ domain-containing protein [Spirochaetales bacterium]
MAESIFKNRNMPRSKVSLSGFYQYSNEWFPCTFYDLSNHGAGLKINQFFLPGDAIALKFGLNSDQQVVRATVANVNGTRIGTRFQLEETTQQFLDHILGAFKRPSRRNA